MKSVPFLTYLKNFAAKTQQHLQERFFEQKPKLPLKDGDTQYAFVLNEAQVAVAEQLIKLNQEFFKQLDQKESALADDRKKIEELQSQIKQAEEQILIKQNALSEITKVIDTNQHQYNETCRKLKTLKTALDDKLETQGMCKKTQIFTDIREEILNENILEINRISFDRQEQLKADTQKVAQKILQSIYYRYQPRFVWPKSAFAVEFTNQGLIEKYFAESSPILRALLENTDTSINVLNTETENQFLVKIVGGLGVDKEIIRLTLEECRAKKILNLDKIIATRKKYQQRLDGQILNMGQEATRILGIDKVHPEILKLVGSLNFRTSHRQNQYYHSLEVAVLSGMLADELGLDPNLAKRSGLFHDIGKVLDYKIEGSHAVISGDYAAKFHENTQVVDTVLAHHDDKIVDTPHAYLLKAADAMSGARPGARVDMEDGYNRRLDGISAVVQSFQDYGVTHSAIMHAGREVHVYVDSKKTPTAKLDSLAHDIAKKLETDVEYPGQIRVTVVRRTEVTAVA